MGFEPTTLCSLGERSICTYVCMYVPQWQRQGLAQSCSVWHLGLQASRCPWRCHTYAISSHRAPCYPVPHWFPPAERGRGSNYVIFSIMGRTGKHKSHTAQYSNSCEISVEPPILYDYMIYNRTILMTIGMTCSLHSQITLCWIEWRKTLCVEKIFSSKNAKFTSRHRLGLAHLCGYSVWPGGEQFGDTGRLESPLYETNCSSQPRSSCPHHHRIVRVIHHWIVPYQSLMWGGEETTCLASGAGGKGGAIHTL